MNPTKHIVMLKLKPPYNNIYIIRPRCFVSTCFTLGCLQKELREEDRRYRENLRQIYEEERRREAELEGLIQMEVERMWQKRLAQWKLEREARKKLMQDVLAIRAQQVQERCEWQCACTYPCSSKFTFLA